MKENYKSREKIFFDTNVFIDSIDRDEPVPSSLLENAVAENCAATSTVTVMEYCTGIFNEKNPASRTYFVNFLEENCVRVYPIDVDTAVFAAKLRGAHPSLRSMDALQLASAAVHHCSAFYTNDRRLAGVDVPGVDIRLVED